MTKKGGWLGGTQTLPASVLEKTESPKSSQGEEKKWLPHQQPTFWIEPKEGCMAETEVPHQATFLPGHGKLALRFWPEASVLG